MANDVFVCGLESEEQEMITGIDISHWDGAIDWAKVKPQVGFAILKASEGTNWTDDTYAYNKAGCEINGIPHGVYHFFRSNQDPAAQAAHFVATVNDANTKFYAVDVETNDGGEIRTNLKVMLQEVERLTGKIPRIYTAYYFWNDNIGPQDWASRCPLWVANYVEFNPLIPNGWSKYEIWQYASNGNIQGINARVDMNSTDGNLADIFGNGELIPPSPAPMWVRVNVGALTIRSAPVVTTDTVLGYTTFGKIWTVEDKVPDDQGRDWLKVGASAYIAGWLCEAV